MKFPPGYLDCCHHSSHHHWVWKILWWQVMCVSGPQSMLHVEPNSWHQVGFIGRRVSGPQLASSWSSELMVSFLQDPISLGEIFSLFFALLGASQLSLLHFSCSCILWMTNILALLFGRTANMKTSRQFIERVGDRICKEEPRL